MCHSQGVGSVLPRDPTPGRLPASSLAAAWVPSQKEAAPVIQFKLAELDFGVDYLGREIIETAAALPVDQVLADARLKCFALMERKQAIAATVATLKAMLATQ